MSSSAHQKPNQPNKPNKPNQPKKPKASGNEWILASVVAAAAYGASSFLIYVLNRQSGRFNSAAMNLSVYIIVCALSLGLVALNRARLIGTDKQSVFNNYNQDLAKIFTTKQFLLFVLTIAATTVVGNVALYASYRLAPNPGYCDVVSSSSAFVALLLGLLLFGQHAKAINVAGMLLLVGAGYLILA